MKNNTPEDRLIKSWMASNPPEQWTSLDEITKSYNTAHDPFTVNTLQMFRVLKRLKLYRTKIDGRVHYVRRYKPALELIQ